MNLLGHRPSRDRSEEGAVAIVVAACLVVFMGVLAVVIDLGMTRSDRSRAQGVADNAALTAAYTYCETKKTQSETLSQTAAQTAASNVASANGYTGSASKVGEGWQVDITSTTKGSFMRALVSNTQVTSVLRAVADAACGTSASFPALFAIGSCPDALLLNGQSTVTGDIHSNGTGKVNGVYVVNGNVTSVGSLVKDPPPAVVITGSAAGGQPPQTDPVGENIADWRPSSARAAALNSTNPSLDKYFDFGDNTIKTSNITKPGVYYTKKGVQFDSDGSTHNDVTFVIDNPSGEKVFEVVKKNITMTHYSDATWNPKKLAVITNAGPGCGKEAVLVNDEGFNHTGVIYAPNGYILVNAQASAKNVGSFIGGQLRINGNGWKVVATVGQSLSTSGITLVR